ncbi:MAG: hypothetical protein Q8P82_03005 [bacterium]|nr:hypothetical protein [bacterium]
MYPYPQDWFQGMMPQQAIVPYARQLPQLTEPLNALAAAAQNDPAAALELAHLIKFLQLRLEAMRGVIDMAHEGAVRAIDALVMEVRQRGIGTGITISAEGIADIPGTSVSRGIFQRPVMGQASARFIVTIRRW